MDDLPDEVAWNILHRLKTTSDRNSVSLTCKRLYDLDNKQRTSIRIGCGINPANEALTSLCTRFHNLERVEISYSGGWMSRLGQQLDDRGLHNLSLGCPFLKDLTLSYCTSLGNNWRRLKRFEFCVEARYLNGYGRAAADRWRDQDISCDDMVELKFVNGIISCILGKCTNLRKLHLDMCHGVQDSDISSLARASTELRSVDIRVPSNFSNHPTRLTDVCLRALARYCTRLETVRLCKDGETYSSFTLDGILCLVRMCPVKELALNHVCSFGDLGMEVTTHIQMAFIPMKQCTRGLASSTTPRLAATSVGAAHHHQSAHSGGFLRRIGAQGPMGVVIGIIGGMVGLAACIGIHTAKQQLLHSPSVQVTKKRRECIPEVESPDDIVSSADKFVHKSFLRKVGRIQERHGHNVDEHARYGHTHGSPGVETLKSVGVRT
ncbi:F-box/LRR-repeat protein 14 [Striga hermonthica]|uniref:F-box/LRR-repeat protein 14 n=1 Tax=Striga hermonthica TaxID=68872 RepID=A0A9N7RF15_STRHE|nr:F-box/LRR-repeat protein 14 [Striga hermonthica]